MKLINIKILALVICLGFLSSCYDELDKTEAFEPFTKLTFTPEDGNFEGQSVLTITILAPGLENATAKAVGGTELVDLGSIAFSNGEATLMVNVTDLKGANRIDFTATNVDGRLFTTKYDIFY